MGFEAFFGPRILMLPVLLLSIVVHEFAHAWTAYLAGDATAKSQGRLTLNPIVHIDPIGTIILPLFLYAQGGFMFGWAKPVPVNPLKFRSSEWDLFVSLAGPGSNFIQAAIGAVLLKLALVTGLVEIYVSKGFTFRIVDQHPLFILLFFCITLNCMLGLLNLIPIPPLDGSRVVMRFLISAGSPLAAQYAKLEPYGFIILILILISPLGKVFNWVLDICIRFILGFVL